MLIHPTSYWITDQYYSFHCPPLHFAYEAVTLFGETFQSTSAPAKDGCNAHIYCTLLCSIRFVLSGFRSLLLTGSQLVSLPAATKMFQFTAFLPISRRTEIIGSTLACSYPMLFAACHVRMETKPGHPLNGVALTNWSCFNNSLLHVCCSNLYSHDARITFVTRCTYCAWTRRDIRVPLARETTFRTRSLLLAKEALYH